MKSIAIAAAAIALPLAAQEPDNAAPSPGEIVAEAGADEWIAIAPDDLVVMELAPRADGTERKVVIQLMPAPFSQGWVENVRTLARTGYWEGSSVNRVQDNYVVQWGQPDPGTGGVEKPVPEGLRAMGEEAYTAPFTPGMFEYSYDRWGRGPAIRPNAPMARNMKAPEPPDYSDPYAGYVGFAAGFPVGMNYELDREYPIDGFTQGAFVPDEVWPVHCYGMVGVGRDLSPNTGDGSQLYTVIGQAPRHLDRNIALVGRIIAGIEHLSSLTRGSGPLGFYTEEEASLRTPIRSVRVASDLPADRRPEFEYLDTDGSTFLRYTEARANRRDPFFNVPAGGADICNIPVPVRAIAESAAG
ncbi:peptidylprolyl isomerase [Qipengyuania sp. JC766]|uniref:peptidylprolyl isomerase n=1 Tax=Qipengyuania sp. JC766 TaxID=3232139 RepID=UPI00345A088A